jgi:3-oxoadipate enol-lactonase
MPTTTRPGDGLELHYDTYGFEGDAPVVVFLNGMSQSTLHWKSLGRALSERWRVVTYDARGQGKTPVGELELTLERHADDLAALLEHLGVARAHLVGFSHGARVALAFANHHPSRLDRLVLCSATARPTALARTIVASWRGALAAGGLEAMSWAAMPMILGDRFLEQNEKLLSGIVRASVQRNQQEGLRRLLDAMIAYPALDELARGVQAPTLVLSGDEDPLVTAEGARELALLCDGRHVEITGVGHTIPIEDPERFKARVEEHLR